MGFATALPKVVGSVMAPSDRPETIPPASSTRWLVAPSELRILVVDDERASREGLLRLFSADGYQTSGAFDGASALATATIEPPDLVITDLRMPGMDGIELCSRLHKLDADMPVIVLTGAVESEVGAECLRVGAEAYFSKPVDFTLLAWSAKRALERRAGRRERERLRRRSDELHAELRNVNERLLVSSVRQQELAETEALQRAQLHVLLGGLSEGVVIVDGQGRLQMLNASARRILGLGTDALSTEALDALEVQDAQGRVLSGAERPLRRALRGEDFTDAELFFVDAASELRCLVSTGTNVKDGAGHVVLAIVLFRDVTALRRLEQQRAEYTALISHDLRNPLNVVLMTVHLLKSTGGGANAEVAGHLTRVERNVHRMTTMVAELTEATTLESKGVELARLPCDLAQLAVEVIGNQEEGRARRVALSIATDASFVVLGDAERLERCVTNLLTNALKYSADDSPVILSLARVGDDVVLAVVDRGIGIAPENIGRLFGRYYRTQAGKARAEGLGLGLYITRLIIEAHGGRIDVASAVGAGSTFTIRLRAAPAGLAPSPAASA